MNRPENELLAEQDSGTWARRFLCLERGSHAAAPDCHASTISGSYFVSACP